MEILNGASGPTAAAPEKGWPGPPYPNRHHSQLSALLGGRNCSQYIGQKHMFFGGDRSLSDYLYLSSAGGLFSAMVCSYDFIVFNCLTGCFKVLPPPIFRTGFIRKATQFFLLHDSLWMGRIQAATTSFSSLLWNGHLISSSLNLGAHAGRLFTTARFRSSQGRCFCIRSSSDQLSLLDADFWWLESSEDGGEHCLLAYHTCSPIGRKPVRV
ncbi:hypothetical protein GOP47_0024919 [Adiantum capillus-veneris]|uniref:Uncharacterized protein n=1 Tax=Adiantum capillus-veneris TaxID=13818 RepID=A0A9D4U2N9_ADICA|nr:hypothetical protein GOP47_0024919 [Adiantum capillus-veneris]